MSKSSMGTPWFLPQELRWVLAKNCQTSNGSYKHLIFNLNCEKSLKFETINRYKDGNLITPNDRIKTTVSPDGVCQLMIASTTNDDTGLYTIEVSNDAGVNKSDASGTVSGQLFRECSITPKP